METQEARPYPTFFAEGEASEDGRIDLFRHTPVLRQILSAPARRSPLKALGTAGASFHFWPVPCHFQRGIPQYVDRLTGRFLKGGSQ